MPPPWLSRHQVVKHKKFLEFVSDFNLAHSSMITSHDLGAIFMASQKKKHMDDAGCLTFEDFWEALCRCALVAYADKAVSLPNKLKALFLLMTREIKWSDAHDGSGIRNVDSNPHHFYLGAKQFQNAVVAQWLDDGKPDYLTGKPASSNSGNIGRDLLKKMAASPAKASGGSSAKGKSSSGGSGGRGGSSGSSSSSSSGSSANGRGATAKSSSILSSAASSSSSKAGRRGGGGGGGGAAGTGAPANGSRKGGGADVW